MGEIVKVPFHGEELQAVREGDRVFVVVKRVCEALGLNPHSQRTKLQGTSWATNAMIASVAEDGKTREVFCVDLECLPMWLAGINEKKVRPELHDKLVRYQREAKDALAAHFGLTTRNALVLQQPQALDALTVSVAGLARVLMDTRQAVISLVSRMDFVEQHVSYGGAISDSEHRALMASIGDLAEREILAKNKGHKNRNAARRDIQNALGEACQWGGKSQPWSALPRERLFAAKQVIQRRQADVRKLICGMERQMSFPTLSLKKFKP